MRDESDHGQAESGGPMEPPVPPSPEAADAELGALLDRLLAITGDTGRTELERATSLSHVEQDLLAALPRLAQGDAGL